MCWRDVTRFFATAGGPGFFGPRSVQRFRHHLFRGWQRGHPEATTVGYGDYVPTTTVGKIVAVAVFYLGIAAWACGICGS
jgi:hypothetical protein